MIHNYNTNVYYIILISTRLFLALPDAVLLLSNGTVSACPSMDSLAGETLKTITALTIEVALELDSSQLEG